MQPSNKPTCFPISLISIISRFPCVPVYLSTQLSHHRTTALLHSLASKTFRPRRSWLEVAIRAKENIISARGPNPNLKTHSLRQFLSLCLLVFITACSKATVAPAPTPRPVPSDALVIRNGMVFDGTGAVPIRNGMVVIQGNRIFAVGHAPEFAVPSTAKTLDAGGGTILPGIINAHTHETASPLIREVYFAEKGVTATCDLGSPLYTMPWYADFTSYGAAARGFRAGPIINAPLGYPGTPELLYAVNNADEARAAVDDLVSRGADMIKLAFEPWNSKLPWETPPGNPIPNLDLDEVRAIVAQAHTRGKLVRVHLGTAEFLDLALDGGVDTIEHVPLPRLADIDFSTLDGGYARLSPGYEAQLARVVNQQVIMVPTLDKIISWCDSYAITPERKTLCTQYATAPVHRFHTLGGVIGLGDDSGYESRTGMPVREMDRLLEAGLTPTEVLQAGTRVAAQVCGHGNELGTLEPGKLADVIVVGGNPLLDIHALENLRTVIVDGKVAVSR